MKGSLANQWIKIWKPCIRCGFHVRASVMRSWCCFLLWHWLWSLTSSWDESWTLCIQPMDLWDAEMVSSDALGCLMRRAAVLGWLFGSFSLSHSFLEAETRQAVHALSGCSSCCLSTYRKQVPGLPHIQLFTSNPESLIWCHFNTI